MTLTPTPAREAPQEPHEQRKPKGLLQSAVWRQLVGPLSTWLRKLRATGHSPFAVLRRRLVITNVVVVAVVLLALCTTFYAYEVRVTQAQVDQQLASEAMHEAARGLPELPMTADTIESPYVPGSPNLFAIFVAIPGRVVQDDDQVGRYGLPDWASMRVVLTGAQPNAASTVLRNGTSYRLYTVPVRAGTRIIGAVQAGTSLTVYSSHLQSLFAILGLLSVCVLLLTTILSVSLAERALTPARQAFTRQRQFAAAASHELRTPLAFIRSQAELIAGADATRVPLEEVTGDAREIVTEVDYLTRMTRDLLLLARDEHDTRALTLTAVDLRAILREAATTALPLAKERNVHLDVDLKDITLGERKIGDTPRVWGDSDRLRQLVLILLDNGISYTPPGGTVSLQVRTERRLRLSVHQAGSAVLTVRDTGIGIAQSELPRIFEPFYRASAPHPQARDDRDNKSSNSDSGTGLGLALAQWIVHAHGGAITVHSTLGEGSAFTITLPLVASRSHDAAGSSVLERL